MTSVSITTLPNCSSTDYYCDDYEKAENMSFLVIYDKGYDFVTERDSGGMIATNPKDMPWNVSSNGFDIWPHILSADLWFIGVYWPQEYEVIFIVNNGDVNNSAIAYNAITEENWWKHLKINRLNSEVLFNGLFTLNDSVYAIGDNYKVFQMVVDEQGNRTLVYINQTVRQFFNCQEPTERPKRILTVRMSQQIDDQMLMRQMDGSSEANRTNTANATTKPLDWKIITTIIIVIVIALLILVIFILGIATFINFYRSSFQQKTPTNRVVVKNQKIIHEGNGSSSGSPEKPLKTLPSKSIVFNPGSTGFHMKNVAEKNLHEPVDIESRTAFHTEKDSDDPESKANVLFKADSLESVESDPNLAIGSKSRISVTDSKPY